MKPGVYITQKKDGTTYYRSSLTYKNKHISLGSFPTEELAHTAYLEASTLVDLSRIGSSYVLEEIFSTLQVLGFEKAVSILNFRDNGLYIGNPIYLHKNYFSYYLSENEELKFDIDDLFYYSSHKILRRQGHLYVNDYGMQVTLLSRYGIKNYAVQDRDYHFANGDTYDMRYSNIILDNRYIGVCAYTTKTHQIRYRVKLHINGNYTIGTYLSEVHAAIAYNKAVDLAKAFGISKNFATNYVEELSAKDYAEIYTKLKVSAKYMNYLKSL